MSISDRIYRYLSQLCTSSVHLLYKHTILVLSILLCIGMGIALSSMFYLSSSLIESQALQNSIISIKALNEAGTLYSEKAVNRAKLVDGISVTHDYHNKPGAIPNPATYKIELGKRINANPLGSFVRLYSDYPFPHRQTEGGPKDKFEQAALTYLRKYPERAFYRQEKIGDRLFFRYAEPLIMKPSCVACHNTHLNSPRKDWQVGDVRGVLQIAQPIDTLVGKTIQGLKLTFMMLVCITILGVSGLALVMGRLRQTSKELEYQVRERTAKLEQLASLDGLTQIANRRRFDEYLDREWKRSRRLQLPLSLILMDVDYFKHYNDTYGHQAGDDCLRSLARTIKETLKRSADLVARYGGEEFAVILPDTSLQEAIQVAKTIQLAVRQLHIPHATSGISDWVTFSLGIATIVPVGSSSPKTLISLADEALYEAKNEGRDTATPHCANAIAFASKISNQSNATTFKDKK